MNGAGGDAPTASSPLNLKDLNDSAPLAISCVLHTSEHPTALLYITEKCKGKNKRKQPSALSR